MARSCGNMFIERCTFVQRFSQSVCQTFPLRRNWMNMHHQLRQQQDEPLLQLQQAGGWSHGHTPQVADSLVCDTPVPIRVVLLNQPAGNPLPTGAAPAVADTRPAPTQPGLTQYFHPPAVHKEWRVEVAAPMETAAGSDQSRTRSRSLGRELKRASAAAEEDAVPGASTVPYERPVVQQHMRQDAVVASMFLQPGH